MSLSTITIGKYSLSAKTAIVEVVNGFLLKALSEKSTEGSPALEVIVKQLRDYATCYQGFVRLELPEMTEKDLDSLADAISECLSQIRNWGILSLP